MDMFMDKLAQKLNAQEIIRANTAADVEELNKLKNQITEYNECLVRLQRLIDEGFGKISGIRGEEGEIARLAGESSEGIKALREDTESFRRLIGQQQGQLDMMEKSLTAKMESLSVSVAELAGRQEESLSAMMAGQTEEMADRMKAQFSSMIGQTEFLTASVREKVEQLCGQLEAQSSGGLSERLDALEENVHKECVKVYRNVQAVMVEESGKQSEALTGALTETKEGVAFLKKKVGAVLGISVAAMILSLAGVLYQVLSGLNALPF